VISARWRQSAQEHQLGRVRWYGTAKLDLPITKGLQENIHAFRRLDDRLELEPILQGLAQLPAVVGGLSVALARSFKIVDPTLRHPQTQQWDMAFALFGCCKGRERNALRIDIPSRRSAGCSVPRTGRRKRGALIAEQTCASQGSAAAIVAHNRSQSAGTLGACYGNAQHLEPLDAALKLVAGFDRADTRRRTAKNEVAGLELVEC